LAANANLIPDFLPPVTSFRLGAHSFACEEALAEWVAFEPSSEVFRQRDTDHRTVNRGPRRGRAILLLTRVFFERRMQNISEVQFEQLARTF
jgi:hypothetical protein